MANKGLPLPPKTVLLVLMVQDAPNYLPKKLKALNGNTVNLLEEKEYAMSLSPLLLSHNLTLT